MEENNADIVTINKSAIWKYGALILALGLIVMFFVRSGSSSSVSGSGTRSGIQKIVMGYKNYNYYPNTIKVKAGEPVSITLDSSVPGCYRSLVIPDFNINEYSSKPSQTIDFTPEKKGTFKFRCGMGMGTGILVVE